MKKMNIRFIADSAIIAALYVALTWLLAPISYGAVQFRISEALILLVALNPKYAYALIVGCFVANTTSPLGWYDMVFGTLATILGILPILKIKRLELASLFPVLSNAIIVSIELGLAFDMFAPEAFVFNVLTIGLGEAVVLYCVGIPLMMVLCKNQMMRELLELENSHIPKHSLITLPRCISTVLGALGIIFYIAYPFLERTGIDAGQEVINSFSSLTLTKEQPWVVVFCVLGIATILWGLFTKKKVKLIGNICIWIGTIIGYIFIGICFKEALQYSYYYGYIVYLLIYAIACGYIYKLELKKQVLEE
ncbi:MAG: QueT transporter family protein [Anaeroplasmataceae bacterium]|nr:QueT transporter family protein [Anaeroplasmataceae bacterium]